MDFDLTVIGGGAAGFFGAIQYAEMRPGSKVVILEKSTKVLSKVRVSGGGRCNVTHHCLDPFELSKHYPRGEKSLKNLFPGFHAEHMIKWLLSKGVKLKAESDGRMFPISDSSETIIECFIREVEKLKIKIFTGKEVRSIVRSQGLFKATFNDGNFYQSKKILIATGGNSNKGAYEFIAQLGHTILSPIPSLFTFNDSEKKFTDLMGISLPSAEIKIAGTKFLQRGPLLITHWGLSGPAAIKLSAWGAEFLNRVNYEFTALVSWIGPVKEDVVRAQLENLKASKNKQKILTNPLFSLPLRLWERLCSEAEIQENKIWSEVSQRSINKLVESLIRRPFKIKGKTTFKEEFVTCGGVDVREIDLEKMESKVVKNVFFAGEVLNIDGETGGFNFQSAWTTAFFAAKAMAMD